MQDYSTWALQGLQGAICRESALIKKGQEWSKRDTKASENIKAQEGRKKSNVARGRTLAFSDEMNIWIK